MNYKPQSLVWTLFLSIFLLSACNNGPIRLYIPQTRFDLPEAAAANKIILEAGYTGDEYTITFTEKSQSIPVDTKTPVIIHNDPDDGIGSGTFYLFTARFSPLNRLELSYSINEFNTASIKYQLIGKSRTESQEGDFSAAIAVKYGDATDDEDRDDFTLETHFWDYSALAGYRITDRVLLYTSAFETNYNYVLFIDPLAINSFRERYSEDIKVNGVTLGANVRLNKNFDITFEALKSDIKTVESKQDGMFYGINFVLLF